MVYIIKLVGPHGGELDSIISKDTDDEPEDVYREMMETDQFTDWVIDVGDTIIYGKLD